MRPPITSSSIPSDSWDVVVIGAGAAGLMSCLELPSELKAGTIAFLIILHAEHIVDELPTDVLRKRYNEAPEARLHWVLHMRVMSRIFLCGGVRRFLKSLSRQPRALSSVSA